MLVPAVELYATGLRGSGQVTVRDTVGRTHPLPTGDWVARQLPGDAGLLDRCAGATLDVGCGPGRLTLAVAARGLPVLGVDLAPGAVELAWRRGAFAVVRSVFDRLPGDGRWVTVLLVDGNVGIGGDVTVLLGRLRDLLAHDGRLLLELGPPGSPTGAVQVRLEAGDRVSDWFPWAYLAAPEVAAAAAPAGLVVTEAWVEAGRWFAALTRD